MEEKAEVADLFSDGAMIRPEPQNVSRVIELADLRQNQNYWSSFLMGA